MKNKSETIIGSILLFIITGAVIWYIISVINNGMTDMEGGLIIFFGPLLILILIRIWIIGFVKKLMRKESRKVESGLPQELELPEKKATTRPVIIHYDKTLDTNAAAASREKFVAKAYKLFRKGYFFGLIACAGYFIFPFFTSIASGRTDKGISVSFILSFLYFLYISIQFLIFRKQFKPGNFRFSKFHHDSWLIKFLKIIPYVRMIFPFSKIVSEIIKEIFHPRWGTIALLILFLLMIMSGVMDFSPGIASNPDPEMIFIPDPWRGAGVFVAILLHVYLFYLLRKSIRDYPNNSLLILRVFGTNEKVELTFGHLARFWQHFGTWFTIVDPSFLSPRFRFFTFRTLLELISIFLLQFTAVLCITWVESMMNLKSDIPVSLNIAIGAFIGYVVYILYWRLLVIRGFAKDMDKIREKMNKVLKHPRRFDLTYKNLPIFCYDNTWRLAVNEFIKKSRVVLMDLRGFSDKRKGCEYEIDFLFDTFPINRVLFLVDNDTDRNFIYQTILDRWDYLRVNSPNLSISDPVAKIFICHPEEDQSDVQKMMDLLIDASCEST